MSLTGQKKTHCKRGHLRTPDNVTRWNQCIACANEFDKKRYEENPEKRRESSRKWYQENPEKARNSRLKRYGLTLEQIEQVPDICEVCGKGNGKIAICVDHNHETNKIRGFLCSKCNTAIGLVNDDPALLEKLALYLRERR